MDKPVASIAIITYNQEAFIGQTLDHMLAQVCSFPFEIVVGEDASPDNTRAIIEAYEIKHPGIIRLMPKAANKGLLRNFGDTLRSCKGEFLAICAGDDYWHDPNKLERQVKFLQDNPDYGLVHTDLDYYHQKNAAVVKNFNKQHQSAITDGDVLHDLITSKFFINALTACFRKSLFDKYVDFDLFARENFAYEDLATWLSLAPHTKFKYFPESMATYRVIENSVSRPKDNDRKFRFLREHYKIKHFFIKKYNIDTKTATEFEDGFHRKKFDLGFKWNNPTEAEESYQYLEKRGLADSKLKLKRKLLGIPILYKTVNKIKKLYTAKTSVSHM